MVGNPLQSSPWGFQNQSTIQASVRSITSEVGVRGAIKTCTSSLFSDLKVCPKSVQHLLPFCDACWFIWMNNNTAGQHRHISRPVKKILINLCQQLKNDILFWIQFPKFSHKHRFRHWFLQLLASSTYRSFEAKYWTRSFFKITFWNFKTNLWDLDSGHPANIFTKNEFDFRRKPQKKSQFCKFEPMRVRMAGTHSRKCLSCKIIHRRNSPLRPWWKKSSLWFRRQMSWKIKENHTRIQVLEFSANQVSAESNKIKVNCFRFL